jgi:hypothetical protein
VETDEAEEDGGEKLRYEGREEEKQIIKQM